MRRKNVIIIILAAVITGSCYYDSEEYLYPQLNNNCDTTSVTFSGSVIPLLQDHCWSCHANSNAAALGNNIRLEDYNDIKAESPFLLGAIRHEPPRSFMPKDAPMLSNCLIQQFAIWVDDGTPQN